MKKITVLQNNEGVTMLFATEELAIQFQRSSIKDFDRFDLDVISDIKQWRRAEALSKLTHEEKEILGLNKGELNVCNQ